MWYIRPVVAMGGSFDCVLFLRGREGGLECGRDGGREGRTKGGSRGKETRWL